MRSTGAFHNKIPSFSPFIVVCLLSAGQNISRWPALLKAKIGIQNMQSAVHISDKSVTLKQSQGHQIYKDNVDPKQGYKHAKFERSCFHGVKDQSNDKGFFQTRENVNHLS